MRRFPLVKSRLSVFVPSVLVFLVALAFVLAAMPTPALAQAKDQRVVFGSAGFTESNRFWTIARPEHLQYDPFWRPCSTSTPRRGNIHPVWRKSGRSA